jgi:hypothetical protein
MWSRLKSFFIADINIITHDKKLLARSLAPFILILILKLVFPLLSGIFFSKTGHSLYNYYAIVAITFIAIIPMFPGEVYAFILLDDKNMKIMRIEEVDTVAERKFLFMRMISPLFISFILVLLTILLTKPVPTEGWLRTLFSAFLLSIQSLFVFLFITTLAENKTAGVALSRLYWIFLIAVPAGLLLHHPLNYFAFYSPLYWVAWTWIIPSPVESMIYGSVALILTSGASVIFYRHFVKKHAR